MSAAPATVMSAWPELAGTAFNESTTSLKKVGI